MTTQTALIMIALLITVPLGICFTLIKTDLFIKLEGTVAYRFAWAAVFAVAALTTAYLAYAAITEFASF